MSSTVARRLSRRGLVFGGAGPLAAMLATLALAAPASATPSLHVTVQTSTPEQGVPVSLEFAGNVDPGDGSTLYAVVRPAGGIACQPTFESDQSAAGSASSDLVNSNFFGTSEAPGTFQTSDTYSPPNIGSYLVCAWLEHYAQAANGNVADATASTSFSTRGPQVSLLTVNLPTPARPNVAYQINYTTQTDQQLSLDSIIKAAGGLPCASSFELEQQQNQSETELLGPDGSANNSIFGGPQATTVTDTEAYGPHVICTWIEGPNSGEVDAAKTTPIYVGTPSGTPPPKRPHWVRRCTTKRLRRHHHWVRVRRCRWITVYS